MKRAFRLLSHLVVLVIGVLAGRVWGTWYDYSSLWDEVAQRDSVEVDTRVTALSQLRLGRIDDAIEFLEMPLDNEVQMIAFGESNMLNLNAKSMKPNCLRALQMAKAYRSLYPSTEPSSDPPPDQILAQIPDITFPAECKGALCTLLKNRADQVAKDKTQ